MAIATIGLTGGIGSGKSTVAAMLVDRGAWLVDTDAIARALTLPGGAALGAIAQAFGADMITPEGALDRDRMRTRVFGDAAAKLQLERILHPMIGAQAESQARRAAGRPVVFDVPLLAESVHWRQRVERVLVVDCPEPVQIQRVMQRSGWEADAVRRVIEQQAPRARRRTIADAVIFNGEATTLVALNAAVDALWTAWCGPGTAV
jgi:dephospho-CoA kinase